MLLQGAQVHLVIARLPLVATLPHLELPQGQLAQASASEAAQALVPIQQPQHHLLQQVKSPIA